MATAKPKAPAATGPTPGPEPRANPRVRFIAVLVSLLLLAFAGVVGRDLWFQWVRNAPGDTWVGDALQWITTLPADTPAVAAGIGIALVGLWLIASAFTPRVRTHVRATSPVSIWVRPVDIARRATFVARRESDSQHVSSRASRSRVRVDVEKSGAPTDVARRIEDELTRQFRSLTVAPRVAVNVTEPAGERKEGSA